MAGASESRVPSLSLIAGVSPRGLILACSATCAFSLVCVCTLVRLRTPALLVAIVEHVEDCLLILISNAFLEHEQPEPLRVWESTAVMADISRTYDLYVLGTSLGEVKTVPCLLVMVAETVLRLDGVSRATRAGEGLSEKRRGLASGAFRRLYSLLHLCSELASAAD